MIINTGTDYLQVPLDPRPWTFYPINTPLPSSHISGHSLMTKHPSPADQQNNSLEKFERDNCDHDKPQWLNPLFLGTKIYEWALKIYKATLKYLEK